MISWEVSRRNLAESQMLNLRRCNGCGTQYCSSSCKRFRREDVRLELHISHEQVRANFRAVAGGSRLTDMKFPRPALWRYKQYSLSSIHRGVYFHIHSSKERTCSVARRFLRLHERVHSTIPPPKKYTGALVHALGCPKGRNVLRLERMNEQRCASLLFWKECEDHLMRRSEINKTYTFISRVPVSSLPSAWNRQTPLTGAGCTDASPTTALK